MEVGKWPPSHLAFGAILPEERARFLHWLWGWMTSKPHMDVVAKKETQALLSWFEPNIIYKAHTKTLGPWSLGVNFYV
jgi:hypothetical protein